MPVARDDDARAVLDRVGPVLRSAEARAIMPLGLLAAMAAEPDVFGRSLIWEVRDGAGAPCGVALQTAGHNMVLGGAFTDADLDEIVDGALVAVPELPGVMGEPEVAAAVVDRWCARTGAPARVLLEQGVYELTAVSEPPAPGGRARPAGPDERDELVGWFRAFHTEAGVPGPDQADRQVDARLRGDGASSGLWVWESGGDPVAAAGFSGPTGTGIRIGPVYTPPPHRTRGYGTALTAALSAHLLAHGHERCFLFTDLANATSNAIYQRVGYRRVGDSIEYGFDR